MLFSIAATATAQPKRIMGHKQHSNRPTSPPALDKVCTVPCCVFRVSMGCIIVSEKIKFNFYSNR